jgi:hypothetical protein
VFSTNCVVFLTRLGSVRKALSVLGMPAPSPVQVLILRASYSWHSMRMCLIVCGLLPQWQSAESDTPMAARYAWNPIFPVLNCTRIVLSALVKLSYSWSDFRSKRGSHCRSAHAWHLGAWYSWPDEIEVCTALGGEMGGVQSGADPWLLDRDHCILRDGSVPQQHSHNLVNRFVDIILKYRQRCCLWASWGSVGRWLALTVCRAGALLCMSVCGISYYPAFFAVPLR